MSKEKWEVVNLPKIDDPRGSLSFIEESRHIPFGIKRVYYLYNISKGSERGAHAHKKLYQLFISLSGSFELHLDDGKTKECFIMNRADQGIFVRNMVWRELKNFSEGAVCLVLASDYYSEEDYYRSYQDFISAMGRRVKDE